MNLNHVVYKGRPLTKAVLQDIVTLFTLAAKDKPVPRALADRLYDDAVEIPAGVQIQR